jgi:Protein of unknown function (DUF2934)
MKDDREQWLKRRAYAIWQTEGCPNGRDCEHWAQAEREFSAEQATAQNTASLDSAVAPLATNAKRGRRAAAKTVATSASSGKKKPTELRP